ncbi:LacI family transcriptional regulator [Streptomonospora alba]|uniref:LacI family transcriptional regulator n=1 Tax=Streptomonospora alba TaxID=183763 RepID=A0A0C2JH14_9ACTN|nr:LacI family DNA-binding transcriptional regulator [Streptomonospora alba]KII00572.1 LacI family transcriptional regulator [Streptomonospora alba]
MATISDVAARAGVSVATASRALNGKATVDPAMAERVLWAAEALDYRPNALARNLRRQETDVVALVISDVENPFFTAVARGVEDVARAGGYSVLLCNSDESVGKEREYVRVAVQDRAAGVIISSTGDERNTELLRADGMPMVAVDRPAPGAPADTVLVDSRQAAAEATRHLLAQGYGRVGCITGPEGIRTADDRLAGYREALREAGMDTSPHLVRRAPFKEEGAAAAARRMLDGAERPDALLVASSSMATGVLHTMRDLALRPGRDVGVVAFDEASWATLVDPPLSVVSQPAYDVGTTAAHLLLARIGDAERAPETTVLSAELVERGRSRKE